MAVVEIRPPLAASVVAVLVEAGQPVRKGEVMVVVEAMKMEHEMRSEHDGEVASVRARVGDPVAEGDLLLVLRPEVGAGAPSTAAAPAGMPAEPGVRTDLQVLRDREPGWQMRAVPKLSPSGVRSACERRARTSPTCATRAVS